MSGSKSPLERLGISLMIAGLSALLICLGLILFIGFSGCAKASEPEPEPDFLGRWVDNSNPPFLFSVTFRENHTVTFAIRNGEDTLSIQDGEWSYKHPFLITRDTSCQVGPPARLVPCATKPDSVRVNIVGDTWRLDFEEDGEIITFNLRRLH